VSQTGVRIDVEERGDGQPVLFIHGLTFDRKMLLEATEPVFGAVRARRIYADLPGHGASPPDARAESAEGLVDSLAGLIDATCDGAPIVVGHSFGGYLALGLAALRPLAGLILVTPVVEPDVGRRRVPPRRTIVDPAFGATPEVPERAAYDEIAVVQSAETWAAYQHLVHAANQRTDRAFLDAVRRRYVLRASIFAQLAERAPRTLVLCGRDDHWVGYEDALTLLRVIPDAELTILPGCGQLLPIEAGDAYRAHLGAFFARL
jgi:pimeloyl-ACP methyl ester carboxylesterase